MSSKRKADDGNLWLVMEDGVATLTKSRKEALDEEDPAVHFMEMGEDSLSEDPDGSNASDTEITRVHDISEVQDISELHDDTEIHEGNADNDPTYEERFSHSDTDSDDDDSDAPFASTSTANGDAGATSKELSTAGSGKPGSKWPDVPVFQLLDLMEEWSANKKLVLPQKSDPVWKTVASCLQPYTYTQQECHAKYKAMVFMYRTLRERKAKTNGPIHWKYFDRMASIVGNKAPPVSSRKRSAEDAHLFNEVKAGPSGVNSVKLNDARGNDELGLIRFDQLLEYKKGVLSEIQRQGNILQQHVDETISVTTRREKMEFDMLEVLKDLRTQEQKKLDLFRKLLDKLWWRSWWLAEAGTNLDNIFG